MSAAPGTARNEEAPQDATPAGLVGVPGPADRAATSVPQRDLDDKARRLAAQAKRLYRLAARLDAEVRAADQLGSLYVAETLVSAAHAARSAATATQRKARLLRD